MRIAVVGGSGTLGRHMVSLAAARDHEVAVLTRATGVDVVSGAGLEGRLAGIEVVVDALNPSGEGRPISDVFAEGAGRVAREAARSGVRRIVLVSIVGIDRASAYPYYAGKLAQEAAYLAGRIPVSVVRATQFHEFAAQVVERAGAEATVRAQRMRVRTGAARSVAEVVVDVAQDRDAPPMTEVAGPDEAYMPDLVARLLRARGDARPVAAYTLPGDAGEPIATGALLPGAGARIVGPTFEAWLAE